MYEKGSLVLWATPPLLSMEENQVNQPCPATGVGKYSPIPLQELDALCSVSSLY